jgi:Ca2+/Na+ antiporter
MTSTLATLLQNEGNNAFAALFGGMALLFWLAVVLVFIIGGWKVFEKAGQPGWAVLVPIYNVYVILRIAGRPGWWLLLYFIPLVNLVIGIIVAIDVAKAFGQSPVFGFFLLFLLCSIGYLILGFGDYQYRRPATASA